MEKQFISKIKLLERAKIRNKCLVDSNRKVRFNANKLEATVCTVEKLQITINKFGENYEVVIAEKSYRGKTLRTFNIK